MTLSSVFAKLSRKKVIIFCLHSANQFTHIENVCKKFADNSKSKKIFFIFLVSRQYKNQLAERLHGLNLDFDLGSYQVVQGLIIWDVFFAIDQRMRVAPKLWHRQRCRVCIFHGQPTKGNVFVGFRPSHFDVFFVYGPMMRSYIHEALPDINKSYTIRLFPIGQPKTDDLVKVQDGVRSIQLRALGLDPSLPTVLYAPSFEEYSSLAMMGDQLLAMFAALPYNTIVKPHPAFYRVYSKYDTFMEGAPSVDTWSHRIASFNKVHNCLFIENECIPSERILPVVDVLITDHSGISFEAVLFDIPLIFIHCAEFFSIYLPKQYSIDGNQLLGSDAVNGGRSAGRTVHMLSELGGAIDSAIVNPNQSAAARSRLRDQLLYNRGNAAERFVRATYWLIGGV